jgi:hypothetical protein
LAEEALVKSQQSAAAKKMASKGKNSVMSGRALFTYQPDLFKDDENAADDNAYAIEEEVKQQIDGDLFAGEKVEEEEVDFD